MKLCYVFSRYARQPQDGKQHAFWRQLQIFESIFEEVSVLGLARSSESLEGPESYRAPSILLTEQVLPGSYDVQCAVSLVRLTTGVASFSVPRLGQWLRQHHNCHSVVLLEGFPLVGLAPPIEKSQLFYSEVDAFSRRATRFRKSSIGGALKQRIGTVLSLFLERYSFERVSRVHVYSAEDARFLRRLHRLPSEKVVAIPMPPASIDCDVSAEPTNAKRLKLLVWADATYPHLERGVRELLQELVKVYALKKQIVFLTGRNAALASDIRAAGYDALEWSESIEATLRDVHVVLIPDVVGTGIKNRTIHAMAFGKCVVGTKFAWEGIPYKRDVEGLCTDSPAGLVSVVCKLSLEQARQIGDAGRRMIQSKYSARALAIRWREFFEGRFHV